MDLLWVSVTIMFYCVIVKYNFLSGRMLRCVVKQTTKKKVMWYQFKSHDQTKWR